MKPENNADNFGRCVCPQCPLYTDCNRNGGERLFCGRTISDCEMDNKKMCICPTCPVYEENKLVGAYFCIVEMKG